MKNHLSLYPSLKTYRAITVLILALAFSAISYSQNPKTNTQPHGTQPLTQAAKLLAVDEHNAQWFTQGLYIEDDTFYISSGQYGRSMLITTNREQTQAQKRRLSRRYFAEGITVIGDTLYLLTWKEKTLFLYNKHTLEPLGKMTYQSEGWGLTHRLPVNATTPEFIMSDGSDTLFFRDTETFAIKHQLRIPGLNYLNELEYHQGIVWASRWYDNHLYGIDSETGCILAKVDLLPLRKQTGQVNHSNIANGVAYDKKKNGLWVTGKYWSKRFLIALPEISKEHC